MKFIIGEDWISYFERLAYRGIIGIAYKDTLGGVIAYILFGLICIFTIIGIISTIKWLFTRGKRKETPGEYWKRTGRMK